MVVPCDIVERGQESIGPRRVIIAESDTTPADLGDDVTLVIPRSNTSRSLRAWLDDAKVNQWLQSGGRLVFEPDIVDSAFQLAPIVRRDPRVFLDRPEPIPAPPGVTQFGVVECIPHHDIAGEQRLFPGRHGIRVCSVLRRRRGRRAFALSGHCRRAWPGARHSVGVRWRRSDGRAVACSPVAWRSARLSGSTGGRRW
jgi:hypothetical protein